MKCDHCGLIHETTCPRIKAIEYNPDGTIRRLEFTVPADYLAPHRGVLDFRLPDRSDSAYPQEMLRFRTTC